MMLSEKETIHTIIVFFPMNKCAELGTLMNAFIINQIQYIAWYVTQNKKNNYLLSISKSRLHHQLFRIGNVIFVGNLPPI